MLVDIQRTCIKFLTEGDHIARVITRFLFGDNIEVAAKSNGKSRDDPTQEPKSDPDWDQGPSAEASVPVEEDEPEYNGAIVNSMTNTVHYAVPVADPP